MNNFIVIGVCVVFALAHAQQPPPNPNIDKDCLTPPADNVDPETCCPLPEMLESKSIDECGKKIYGSVQAADDQRNDSPFAPHIRVNSTNVLVRVINNSELLTFSVSCRVHFQRDRHHEGSRFPSRSCS